jgi:cystathionine beta-lyase/cystathionine gamma-synthase
MVDGTDIKNFENAIQKNTKVLYAESPNSWTYEIQDLSALADLAKKHQLVSIIDNSFSSPLYQSPIALGFDMTVHSGTKYIAGHSDAVAGVVCGTHKMMQHIFNGEFMTLGGVVSPFNAWLLLRGLRTLPIRMKHVGESALKIAKFLEGHEKVEKVYYPFLESSPQYELARKQIKQPTGQLTITIKANDIETVERFCDGLKRFLLAVSWGSHESLIFPACVLYNSENYQGSVFPWNMIRFYIGLEETDILIEDLKQALELI